MAISDYATWIKNNPQLSSAIISAIGGVASNLTQKKGNIQFKPQPETPEEMAYRKYAENLAGMHGTPGPTFQYLAPKIDSMLQNLTASSAAYKPLSRLDPATGQPVAVTPPSVPTSSPSPTQQPWMGPLASYGSGAPSGVPPKIPAGTIGGAAALGERIKPAQKNFYNEGDVPIRGGPFDSGGGSNGPRPGETVYDYITRTNASPTDLNQAFPSGWTPNAGAKPGDPVPGYPGLTYGDGAAVAAFLKQYGADALKTVFGFMTSNPLLTFSGALGLFHDYKNRNATPPTVRGGTGSSVIGGGVVMP